MATSKIKSIERLDYTSIASISNLPYVATSRGVLYYRVGDGSQTGYRNLYVNGNHVGSVNVQTGTTQMITILLEKGDSFSSDYAIWGDVKFVPYK